ncbi:RNA polymerase sigma factor [Aequorivita vladivostokensis]|jgi:RNA polymerase sigma factor (sigma-70 family)|uniref:RNA polymerase sigma factor n=1 Tax=Aequorivita vladivostokensis TaxID=171194 RepID=A0ABR5DJH5_9FLAO|nr:sigma-70 family RNA polymerase sigma factor [Aequorivita vladivostokensis]MAB55971.1 RNA polymerase subunit sigma-70 [Aequorivita sp.]KJJ38933.1 RNA polymerase sigma-70 factor [Aequorivita vladivostokensis]MAO49022.1 RNA polymerase subunit sigma-70 [Aequorivita sp.]MBF30743.1 RNA polymerase subunit sigma-70 [Aequorivita sp.]HAV55262.1 RNA polymerase subunit sigma-70 [Aequorivita sp.]|tara:strand:- start:35489 stop:36022 length:534 start_codon:yes stop_codon:yes gene_type:complete
MEQPNNLITEMQGGNEKAFSQLYTMYSEAIYGIIYSIVLDEATAEELLQDVFIKIWNNAGSYSIEKGRFFTWLLNIARNTAIDETRSKAFKNSRKNLSTTNFVDILSSSDSLNRKTNAIGIKKFVDALKPACIKIIDLLYFKGFTQAEASKTLDIPLGTLKTRNRTCINELRVMVLG